LASEREEAERKQLKRRLAREANDAAHVALAAQNSTIVLDCGGFEAMMTQREIISLVQQIMYCHSANRKSHIPSTLRVVGAGSTIATRLAKVHSDRWLAFYLESDPLEKALSPHQLSSRQTFYLTSDTEYELLDTDLQNNANQSSFGINKYVYIIGGIVDRNRHKGITKARADSLNIQTARLPIGPNNSIAIPKHISPVLTVNHVAQLLLFRQSNQGSWQGAADAILPERKGGTPSLSSSIEKKKLLNQDGLIINEDDKDVFDQVKQCCLHESDETTGKI